MILIPTKKKNNNILYFDNDEAFYNWCVVPQLKTCEYTSQSLFILSLQNLVLYI